MVTARSASCPCGLPLWLAALRTDIVLLRVQVLVPFAFISARVCLGFGFVIASPPKQEDQRRAGFSLALAEAFAAGLQNPAGISEEEIIICALLPQICLPLQR